MKKKPLKDRCYAGTAAVYMSIYTSDAGGGGTEILGNAHQGTFSVMTFMEPREQREYREDENDEVQSIPLSDEARRLVTSIHLLSGACGNAMLFQDDMDALLLDIWLQGRRRAAKFQDIGHMETLLHEVEKAVLPPEIELYAPTSHNVYRRLLKLDVHEKSGGKEEESTGEMKKALNQLVLGAWNAGIVFQQRVSIPI